MGSKELREIKGKALKVERIWSEDHVKFVGIVKGWIKASTLWGL
jgi:hypothetical protein